MTTVFLPSNSVVHRYFLDTRSRISRRSGSTPGAVTLEAVCHQDRD
jgi:hypothetical protein